jgi:hypothetical protein
MSISQYRVTPYKSKYAGEIPPLDHTNYNLWSSSMKIHLQAINAYELVLGDVLPPSGEETDRQTLTEYKTTDAKARGAIQASCSQAARHYLAGIETAKGMWDVLHERLNTATSIKGRLALRRQFRETRPLPGRPLGEFISSLHSLRHQLAGTTQQIDDDTFKDQLLTSLPTTYANLVEIILEREADLTVEDVIRKIQQFEMSKTKEVLSGNTAQVSGDALLAQGRTPTHYRGGSSRGGRFASRRMTPYSTSFLGNCNNCQRYGHKAVNCSQLTSNRPSTATINITCFACGEGGHGTKMCKYQTLTQAQAFKGRSAFQRWKSAEGSASAVIATSNQALPADKEVEEVRAL